MTEIAVKTVLAANISGRIKAGYVLDPGIDLTGYQVQGFSDDTIALINEKGFIIKIKATFTLEKVGK
jgi:hypothetical protein